MSFLVYDLTLLGIFVIFLGIFLYRRRKNIKREGLLLLYRTKWGIKLIDNIGNKHRKALNILSYVSVTIGYLLMAGAIYLIGKVCWIYVFMPKVVRAVKIPPITPLVPYINKLVPSLNLPPFYFTYWVIIIAVIAIFHEFAHGIFAAKSKVRIKSTGFGFFPFFLPIFLAAFVEPDEKQMPKKKIFDQLAVLSAGTFANLITAIIVFGIMALFFISVFVPSGVISSSYVMVNVSTNTITNIGGQNVSSPSYNQTLSLLNPSGLNLVNTTYGDYLVTKKSVELQNKSPDNIVMYLDAPAVKARLESIITAINGEKITSVQKLSDTLSKYSPGQNVTITVIGNESKPYNRTLTLGSDPVNKSRAFIGIGFEQANGKNNIVGEIYSAVSSFKSNNVYYTSRIGEIGIFIYNLLWWLVIIALSVALINMLPMGIFDGGRFFYLTVLAITKKEKIAQWSYKIITYMFIAALFVVMFFWLWYIK